MFVWILQDYVDMMPIVFKSKKALLKYVDEHYIGYKVKGSFGYDKYNLDDEPYFTFSKFGVK